MSISQVGELSLPLENDSHVVSATRLYSEINYLDDSHTIAIEEMKIDDELNPDVALIKARECTPTQRYDGEGEVMEFLFNAIEVGTDTYTPEGKYIPPKPRAIGVIRMNPGGEMFLNIYDPSKHGGPRGYMITKGWRMQTIVPEGVELTFFDYWTPRGFSSKGDTEDMYGPEVLKTETDPEIETTFMIAKRQLMEFL